MNLIHIKNNPVNLEPPPSERIKMNVEKRMPQRFWEQVIGNIGSASLAVNQSMGINVMFLAISWHDFHSAIRGAQPRFRLDM